MLKKILISSFLLITLLLLQSSALPVESEYKILYNRFESFYNYSLSRISTGELVEATGIYIQSFEELFRLRIEQYGESNFEKVEFNKYVNLLLGKNFQY